MRLTVKKKPLMVGRFLKNNNFKELPEWVIWLLDDLMLDIIDEKSENEENLWNENEWILKSDENEEVISIDTVTHLANKEIFDLFMKNPVSAVIEKAKLCNYNIENENLLRKQIQPLCNSSKNLRDALLITLLKKSFSRPILKHSWLYSLRVWGIGYRFVLKQDFEWKFTIVWFYNHDDYEKVLDGRMW